MPEIAPREFQHDFGRHPKLARQLLREVLSGEGPPLLHEDVDAAHINSAGGRRLLVRSDPRRGPGEPVSGEVILNVVDPRGVDSAIPQLIADLGRPAVKYQAFGEIYVERADAETTVKVLNAIGRYFRSLHLGGRFVGDFAYLGQEQAGQLRMALRDVGFKEISVERIASDTIRAIGFRPQMWIAEEGMLVTRARGPSWTTRRQGWYTPAPRQHGAGPHNASLARGRSEPDGGAVVEPAGRSTSRKPFKLFAPSGYGLEVDAARRAIVEYIQRETAQGRPASSGAAQELSRLMGDYPVSEATSIDRAAGWMEAYNFPEDAAKWHLREYINSKNPSEVAKWTLEQLLAEWRGGPPRIAIGTRLVVSPSSAGFEVFPGETWLDVNQLFVGPRPSAVADREYDEIYVRNIDGFRFEHLPIDRLKGLLSRNGRLVIDFYGRLFVVSDLSGPMVAKLEDAGIENVKLDGGFDPGFVSDYRLIGFRPDEPESGGVRSVPWPSSTDHVLVIGGGDRFHMAAEGDVSLDAVPGRLSRMLLQIPNEHFKHISGSLSAGDVRADTLRELHRILTPGGSISVQVDISGAVEAAAVRQGLRDLGFEGIEDFGSKYGDDPEGVWGIVARKPAAWTPRATDHTLVVGGGHAYRDSQAGEVFLDIYPEARPDILSDIRHVSMIPDEHFNRVDFENFDYFTLPEYDALRQTPAPALSEAFRILKPGGTLTGTTGELAAFSADNRTLIVRSLEKAGFEDIRIPVSGYPSMSARKPGVGDSRVRVQQKPPYLSAEDMKRAAQ